MAEGKEVNIMSVEQAIQRELAYRKKIAYFLSEAEFAELLPLEVPSSSKATIPEPNVSQFLRQSLRSPTIARPTSNPRSSLTSAAANDLTSSGPNLKQSPVPSSSKVTMPEANATHILGQNFISHAGQGFASNMISRPSISMVSADEIRPSVTNVKPSPVPGQNPSPFSVSTQNSASIHSVMPMKATPSSFNYLSNQHQKPYYTSDGPKTFCKICQVSCPSPSCYKMHIKGHKHKAKLSYMKMCGNGMVKENTKEQPRCDLCQILCTDQISLDLHFKGQKHRAKLQELEVGKKQKTLQHFWCELCHVPCNSEEIYRLHLKGKTHAARLCTSEKQKKAT
ncbi:uncharacterized protein [Coffea arabica]|uniref:Uncharacterized protein isoform X1 n=1 Tax=Coffea arabica TaxID=13443 RepID=A0A6P6VW08_COFAR|nr:zinc finger protein 346-like [Coffea arabica]XP_027113595.1 zinc finger protein 346-like [Coffea arabica]